MATNIIGQFPVLTKRKSQTDEYGFDYVTYIYVVKTSTIDTYIPKKDDVFTELKSGGYQQISASGINQYAVTSVESNPLQSDLTELTIQTIGTKNTIDSNLPKITMRQGGPLIFGLSSDISLTRPFGWGVANVGLEIEIRFLGLGGNLQETTIYNTYFSKVMPAIFRGVRTPQALAPFDFDFRSSFQDERRRTGFYGTYLGYCCKIIQTERRGALTLYTLTFREAGGCDSDYIDYANTPNIVSTRNIYSFSNIA